MIGRHEIKIRAAAYLALPDEAWNRYKKTRDTQKHVTGHTTASSVVVFASRLPIIVYPVSQNPHPLGARVTVAQRKFQFVDPSTDVSYTVVAGMEEDSVSIKEPHGQVGRLL